MSDGKLKAVEYAAECSFWQDTLLQSYRQIYLTVESIFLAASAIFLVAIASLSDLLTQIALFVSFFAFSILGIFSVFKMRGVVLNRGMDLDFWHNIWLRAEQQIPPELRLATRFKMEQQRRRKMSSPVYDRVEKGEMLNDDEIQDLIGKGLGHTRRVFELWLFQGAVLVWLFLIVMGGVLLLLNFLG